MKVQINNISNKKSGMTIALVEIKKWRENKKNSCNTFENLDNMYKLLRKLMYWNCLKNKEPE